MLVLESSASSARSCRVVLFGEGLVGSAIARELRARGLVGQSTPTPWGYPSGPLRRHLEHVARRDAKDQRQRLTVLWCAGAAGFGSAEEACRKELDDFRAIVDWTARLSRSREDVRFGMLSSAGGLYEGQRLVSTAAVPAPTRPYGELKLREERAAKRRLPPAVLTRIYRLSTVFGQAPGSARRGLITELLANARAERTTLISGHLTTLRDFVWSGDIGRWIAESMLADSTSGAGTEFLISGKPTSIHEVLRVLSPFTSGPLRVQFVAEPTNPEDITFSPGLCPPGWFSTDLATAVARLGCSQRSRQVNSFGC